MASSSSQPVPLPRRIQRLEEAVVNRIAAGEVKDRETYVEMLSLEVLHVHLFCIQVIQRPANAIKEMVENRY